MLFTLLSEGFFSSPLYYIHHGLSYILHLYKICPIASMVSICYELVYAFDLADGHSREIGCRRLDVQFSLCLLPSSRTCARWKQSIFWSWLFSIQLCCSTSVTVTLPAQCGILPLQARPGRMTLLLVSLVTTTQVLRTAD